MSTDEAYRELDGWAKRHEATYGFQASAVVDNEVPPGQIIYGDHEARMPMAVFVALRAWIDRQPETRFKWGPDA